MSVLMTKMPPSVTTNIESRNPAVPVSPPIVPGSSVRRRPKRRSVGKSRSSLAREPGDEDDERDGHDEQDRDDEQPDDEGDRPPTHELVEPVAQASPPVHGG